MNDRAIDNEAPFGKWHPAEPQAQEVETEVEDYYVSYLDVDLGPAVRGEKVSPRPAVGRRGDGRHLLYRGQLNGLHGDSNAGKSMTAAGFVVQELRAGRHVMWLDFEDSDETTIVGRLLNMAVTSDAILERFHYKNPVVPAHHEAVERIVAECAQFSPSLIVIDSCGEAFSLEGIDENQDADVAPWLRRVIRPLFVTDAAILLIDHGTKAADNPLYPSGSKRKRAAITGASYLGETATAFSREQPGLIRLTCAKDRHGHWAKGEVVALVRVTPDPDGGIGLEFQVPPDLAPPGPKDPSEEVLEAALDAVAVLRDRAAPLARGELLEHMAPRRASTKRAGVDAALRVGALIDEQGAKRARLHRWARDLTSVDRQAIAGENAE